MKLRSALFAMVAGAFALACAHDQVALPAAHAEILFASDSKSDGEVETLKAMLVNAGFETSVIKDDSLFHLGSWMGTHVYLRPEFERSQPERSRQLLEHLRGLGFHPERLPGEGFTGADVALVVGYSPRGKTGLILW